MNSKSRALEIKPYIEFLRPDGAPIALAPQGFLAFHDLPI
jgi:hypothetical protein